MAGLLIERLTGEPYGRQVERRILQPLRLRDTSVPGHRSTLPLPHARGYEPVPAGDAVQMTDATEMDPGIAVTALCP